MTLRRTYRFVDGERIEGTWRPIFIRNGDTYFLTELFVFADGVIDCWGWVDLDGLREKLASGWVATRLEPGAEASAHELADWRIEEPEMWVTAEGLLGEVADLIDELNDRPDSTGRCRQALDRYLETRTEADRVALREAYLAVPEHLRMFALGDMDAKDWPLQVLCTQVGERTPRGTVVTPAMHAQADEYFADRAGATARRHGGRPVDGPQDATVMLAWLPGTWPQAPAIEWLRNEYPVPVTVAGSTYASAVHAYWALATTDEAARHAIGAAATAMLAERTARTAPLRPDWPLVRATAMHAVLRAKFTQHPALADVLVATGDARIDYGSDSFGPGDGPGTRNWVGRLLELVRSELVAERAGFLGSSPTAG
ncbi:NADAR family protein [Dactylosporangium sp. NPDC049742]|uniref:NADAR family protein n=1 Tax=Dactylosporangium sp. NPDC049742 TaxID=3154737 RepID=UPI00343B6156